MRIRDVHIVGAGPVGLLSALLLGRAGLSVSVFERWSAAFARPRACGLDHEALRILQAARLMNSIEHLFDPVIGDKTYELQNAEGRRLMEIQWNKPGLCGWAQMNLFHQPDLEAEIQRAVSQLANVEIYRGLEVVYVDQDDECAHLHLRSADGQTQTAASRYVIGADGANSVVRRSLEIAETDLGFAYDWLVVDVVPQGTREWKPYVVQRCDPARPTTAVGSGPGRRRWEFMRLPDEPVAELNRPETAWRLLEGWGVTPDNAIIERSVVYTFRGRWADQWRQGRVLLAGDAAHLMPPFLAQGLCSGLRDAIALAWRLPYALNGHDEVLDSYGPERLAHSRELINQAVELGHGICIIDPEKAAERDRTMLAALEDPTKAVRPPPQPRLGRTGLLASADEQAGLLFPQGRITLADHVALFDDIFQPGWQLVCRPRAGVADLGNVDASLLAAAHKYGLRIVDFGSAGQISDNDGIYKAWFDAANADIAIVRPDFYVFGVANWSQISVLIEEFAEKCGTMFAQRPNVGGPECGAVTEVCRFQVRRGQESAFESGFEASKTLLERSPAYISHRLAPHLENTRLYHLEIRWRDLAGHLLNFRGTPDFFGFVEGFEETLEQPAEVYHLLH